MSTVPTPSLAAVTAGPRTVMPTRPATTTTTTEATVRKWDMGTGRCMGTPLRGSGGDRDGWRDFCAVGVPYLPECVRGVRR